MRPLLTSLFLGVVLLPGVQHGFADALDGTHGRAHCHLVFEESDEHVHVHELVGADHANPTRDESATRSRDTDTDTARAFPCPAPDHEGHCPHAPLSGHGHSQAMQPMLPVGAPSAHWVWTAPRLQGFGETRRPRDGRDLEQTLERPPKV